MLEVEVHKVLVSAKHLVVELSLREVVHTLVGHHRILATLALAVELGNGLAATEVAPPLNDVGRMIDILAVEIGLVSEFLKGFEVIVLIAQPPRVHLPKHPLRGHLIETCTAPGLAHAVGRNLKLERVSQLVGHAVHGLVLNTVGSHPQPTYEVVVGAAIGRAVK